MSDLAHLYLEAINGAGREITPGDLRISIETAAWLLNMGEKSLRNRIAAGDGPVAYSLGFGKDRMSIRLLDLVSFVESHRKPS